MLCRSTTSEAATRSGCPSGQRLAGPTLERGNTTAASGIDFHHDLPQLLPPFQPLERGTRLAEREHAVHDRTQLARAQQAYDLAVLRIVSHGRAHDVPLVPEQPAQVERNLGTGRGPARQESPAPAEGAQRLVPGRLAHGLDHHLA